MWQNWIKMNKISKIEKKNIKPCFCFWLKGWIIFLGGQMTWLLKIGGSFSVFWSFFKGWFSLSSCLLSLSFLVLFKLKICEVGAIFFKTLFSFRRLNENGVDLFWLAEATRGGMARHGWAQSAVEGRYENNNKQDWTLISLLTASFKWPNWQIWQKWQR